MSNSCIRVLADENQILGCKEDIERIEPEIEKISKILNLAGNEVRLKILFLIYNEGEMCPCDLSDVLGMTVPAISQHLRKMKDGNLVKDNKVGQTIFYKLIDEQVSILYPMLKEMKALNNLTKTA